MLKKFEQLFSNVPTPIAPVSGARKIVFCNQAFRSLFQLERDPVGAPCYRIVRGKGPDGLPLCNPGCDRTPRAISGDPPPPFLVWCQPDGEPILLEANLVPLMRPMGDEGPPAVRSTASGAWRPPPSCPRSATGTRSPSK